MRQSPQKPWLPPLPPFSSWPQAMHTHTYTVSRSMCRKTRAWSWRRQTWCGLFHACIPDARHVLREEAQDIVKRRCRYWSVSSWSFQRSWQQGGEWWLDLLFLFFSPLPCVSGSEISPARRAWNPWSCCLLSRTYNRQSIFVLPKTVFVLSALCASVKLQVWPNGKARWHGREHVIKLWNSRTDMA